MKIALYEIKFKKTLDQRTLVRLQKCSFSISVLYTEVVQYKVHQSLQCHSLTVHFYDFSVLLQ